MKFYINRTVQSGPWGGGNNFIRAFYEHFHGARDFDASNVQDLENGNFKIKVIKKEPRNVEHTLIDPTDPRADPDVFLVAGLDNDGICFTVDQALHFKRFLKPNMKIVLRLNENDARKGTSHLDAKLVKLSESIDKTVFVSQYLQDYFITKGWKCKENTVIVNGVDRHVFKSIKHTNEKISIVVHHWSNNPMKGNDVYEWIDQDFLTRHGDDFSFTYVGRTQLKFQRSTHVQPLSGKKLGIELSKHDVYVNGSRNDPGPNSTIEAIACGLPTYVHVDGGGSVEFAGNDHTFSNFGELERILLSKKYIPNVDGFMSWSDCIEKYVEFMI